MLNTYLQYFYYSLLKNNETPYSLVAYTPYIDICNSIRKESIILLKVDVIFYLYIYIYLFRKCFIVICTALQKNNSSLVMSC